MQQQVRREKAGWCCSGWHLWECHITGGFLQQHGKELRRQRSLALTPRHQVQAHLGLGESHEEVSTAAVALEVCPRAIHVTTSTVTSLVQILPLTQAA